jgi:hypothetical protein
MKGLMDEDAKAAEAREIAALGLGEGNEDWGQFPCEDCATCERRAVCFDEE